MLSSQVPDFIACLAHFLLSSGNFYPWMNGPMTWWLVHCKDRLCSAWDVIQKPEGTKKLTPICCKLSLPTRDNSALTPASTGQEKQRPTSFFSDIQEFGGWLAPHKTTKALLSASVNVLCASWLTTTPTPGIHFQPSSAKLWKTYFKWNREMVTLPLKKRLP